MFCQMTLVRRIVFLAYEDFELLDVSGPMAVFVAVNKLSGMEYDSG